MWIKGLVLIIVPVVLLGVFTYKSYRKLPYDYNQKFIRRCYYLFIIAYISLFVFLLSDIIQSTLYEILKIQNFAINCSIAVAALFAAAFIWEQLFVSCKTIRNLKIKDVEISVEELSSIEHAETLQEKEIQTLYHVLNVKVQMMKYIDAIEMKNRNEMDLRNLYSSVLNEYQKKRKDIEVHLYDLNPDGLKKMRYELKLDENELSSIMYTIHHVGFCVPEQFRKQEYIFARINMRYCAEDCIAVLSSDLLIDKEHIILIELLSYYELKMLQTSVPLRISYAQEDLAEIYPETGGGSLRTTPRSGLFKSIYRLLGDNMGGYECEIPETDEAPQKKEEFGVNQILAEFSPAGKVLKDRDAAYGKKVLKEKLYSAR